MRPVIYYVPLIVVGITALLTGGILKLNDPRFVKHPGGFWSPWRLFDDNEWTRDGLQMRRRFFRSMALSLVAGSIAWVVVLAIAGP